MLKRNTLKIVHFFFILALAGNANGNKPAACCKAKNARCLSCVEGISEAAFCAKHPSTCGCPQENLLRMTHTGGWSTYEGDFDSKWSKILSEGEIAVDGLVAQDLAALGSPNAASSQIVAGTNYKFAFADGTQITVLEQPWETPSVKITAVEKPSEETFEVAWCPNSPELFCRMHCPEPKCLAKTMCAMRTEHCCDFTCETPKDSKSELKSCIFPDGSSVPSGWHGPGKGNNYCNQCACNNGAFMCTKMFCGGGVLNPPGAFIPPMGAKPTTWTLKGPWDVLIVQKYLEDFEEIFADTLRVDKSAIESATVTPGTPESEITVRAFLNPMQTKLVETPEFKSMLRANIESTADDLAKGMGYDSRAGSFILEGPWDVNAVEMNKFALRSQFAYALGVSASLVDVEITEDDFMTKIDFTAKSEGGNLAPLNDPRLFQQKFEKQIKNSDPALASILGFDNQYAWDTPIKPFTKQDSMPSDGDISGVNPGLVLKANSSEPVNKDDTFLVVAFVLLGLVLGAVAGSIFKTCSRRKNMQNKDVYTDLVTNGEKTTV